MASIALEGREGVGKSTQMQLLRERLPALFPGREFVFTREPGGTPFADKIYALFKEGMTETNPHAQFGLVAASRFDHVEKVVRPALAAGKAVVTDRFEAATYAYQVMADPAALTPLYEEHRKLVPLPSLTIVIEVPTPVVLARLSARGGESSAFDAAHESFHDRLAEGYREYARRYAPGTARFVDGDRPVEDIHADIVALVKEHLGA
jgi:dTMP kinase